MVRQDMRLIIEHFAAVVMMAASPGFLPSAMVRSPSTQALAKLLPFAHYLIPIMDLIMNRRHAIQVLAAAALAGNTVLSNASATPTSEATKILKPRRLKKGDTIGLVAPASSTREDEDIRFAIEVVQSLGFKVREGKHLYARNQYLAGTDQQRADDINAMFAAKDVDAIICLRGGYGTPRLLPYLDYNLIARNPKVLMGYSDITGILTGIHAKTGLVGYHGPTAKHTYTDYTLAEFKKVMMNPQRHTRIGAPPPFEAGEGRVEYDNRLTRITGGTARGRLIGGNLTLIATLIGTEFEQDFHDRILFLEDVGEAPYRVDRMLTQLLLANKLQQVAGIAFGKFTETEDSGNTYSIEEVLRDRCGNLGIPVVKGFMFGHVEDQTIMPIGIEAELNADDATLHLMEAAVA